MTTSPLTSYSDYYTPIELTLEVLNAVVIRPHSDSQIKWFGHELISSNYDLNHCNNHYHNINYPTLVKLFIETIEPMFRPTIETNWHEEEVEVWNTYLAQLENHDYRKPIPTMYITDNECPYCDSCTPAPFTFSIALEIIESVEDWMKEMEHINNMDNDLLLAIIRVRIDDELEV
jgi:hypothetical protein